MWSEYEITPNNALQYKKEEFTDLKAMKRDIAQVKDEIRKLGNVNVNAIEEYKEILERHTFLSGQYEDLKTAEAQLENIIQELDEGMRKQFTEKFQDIQREFDKAFRELFGGGKGTLELEEDVDILEAGIQYYFPAARKEASEHDAAFRWREGTDCHCPFVCHSESEAISILSSG